MKHLATALLMVCLMALTLTYSNPVRAQDKTDLTTVTTADQVVTPVFDGTQKNLTDSLYAIAQAATSTEVKDKITEAVNVLKDTPKEGGLDAWYGYIVGALGVLFGLVVYFRKKFGKQPEPVLTTYR